LELSANNLSIAIVVMRESPAWSWNCGVWCGVRVYLHASLVVFIVLIFFLGSQPRSPEHVSDGSIAFIAVGVLLAAILLHELGHILATWHFGGKIEVMVLGPLGSWQSSNLVREPHHEVTAAMAGPLANLVGMIACCPTLVAADVSLGDILLKPLIPSGMLNGPTLWLVTVKMLFWFNWLFFLVNLIPAVPLDGGRARRSVLWPVMGYRAAIRTVSRAGMVVSLALCLAALFTYKGADRLVPPWLPLILLAIYLYFSSRQELLRTEEDDSDDDLLGYDFSQGYTSLERSIAPRRRGVSNPLRRWIRQRQAVKQQRLRELEADEERRVDEVLVRVKQLGFHCLSPDERALLNRVSARYRNRLQS
jgi:Zn-dependent protease